MSSFVDIIDKNYDFLTITEDFIRDKILEVYPNKMTVIKYYKTNNQDIYEDFLTRVKGGVPCIGIRSNNADTDEMALNETKNDFSVRTEILIAVNNKIAKSHFPSKRYANILFSNILHILRNNRIQYPNNQKKPFEILSYKVIFNDDDIDLSLLTISSNYILIQR